MSYVYLIASGKAVKIGIADNPKNRLSSLQTANYESLRIYCAFQCESRSKAIQLEGLLHKRYAANKLKGEWFSVAPEKVVTDVLSDKQLEAFIISYQVHRMGMIETISHLIAAQFEKAQRKVSNVQAKVPLIEPGQELLAMYGLTLGVILCLLVGSYVSGVVSMEIVLLLITLGFSFAILFAIALAYEFWRKVG